MNFHTVGCFLDNMLIYNMNVKERDRFPNLCGDDTFFHRASEKRVFPENILFGPVHTKSPTTLKACAFAY